MMNGWLRDMDAPNEVHAPEVTNPRHTGKTRGTKRSWSMEGMEHFNNLAVLVYNDGRERGKDYDERFLQEMIELYGNRNQNAGMENIEAEVANAAPAIVYSEFNMQAPDHPCTALTTATTSSRREFNKLCR